MFRARILLCLAAIVIYLVSPLDVLPEAVFGLIGLLDDLFVVLLVLVYMTIIYRQIVADRGGWPELPGMFEFKHPVRNVS